jgi:hypothetical protein
MPHKEYVVAAVLACALAVIASSNGRSRDAAARAGGPSAVLLADTRAQAPGVLKRDPFTGTLFETKAKEAAELSLEGIIWDETQPLVVINGDVAGIGGVAGGCTVVSIRQDGVTLLRDGRSIKLTL